MINFERYTFEVCGPFGIWFATKVEDNNPNLEITFSAAGQTAKEVQILYGNPKKLTTGWYKIPVGSDTICLQLASLLEHTIQGEPTIKRSTNLTNVTALMKAGDGSLKDFIFRIGVAKPEEKKTVKYTIVDVNAHERKLAAAIAPIVAEYCKTQARESSNLQENLNKLREAVSDKSYEIAGEYNLPVNFTVAPVKEMKSVVAPEPVKVGGTKSVVAPEPVKVEGANKDKAISSVIAWMNLHKIPRKAGIADSDVADIINILHDLLYDKFDVKKIPESECYNRIIALLNNGTLVALDILLNEVLTVPAVWLSRQSLKISLAMAIMMGKPYKASTEDFTDYEHFEDVQLDVE